MRVHVEHNFRCADVIEVNIHSLIFWYFGLCNFAKLLANVAESDVWIGRRQDFAKFLSPAEWENREWMVISKYVCIRRKLLLKMAFHQRIDVFNSYTFASYLGKRRQIQLWIFCDSTDWTKIWNTRPLLGPLQEYRIKIFWFSKFSSNFRLFSPIWWVWSRA